MNLNTQSIFAKKGLHHQRLTPTLPFLEYTIIRKRQDYDDVESLFTNIPLDENIYMYKKLLQICRKLALHHLLEIINEFA